MTAKAAIAAMPFSFTQNGSIVASLRWFERKASYNQSKRSALYLAERYAPWV